MFYYNLAQKEKICSHAKNHPGRDILGKVTGTNHKLVIKKIVIG